MIKTALTILAVAGVFASDARAAAPVATVDGQAIEQRDFDRWLSIAAKASSTAVPDPATGYRRCVAAHRKATPPEHRRAGTDAKLRQRCRRDYVELRGQVMQLLISFKWIHGEAAARNITVTEAEVTAAFREQKEASFPKHADFLKFLERSGQTEREVRERVELDLLSNKLRDQVVAGQAEVSDEAVERYYAENRSRFVEPERRALRVVLTKRRADAQRARAALERGTSWKAVTRRYSVDAETRRRSGKVAPMEEEALEARLSKAVFGARKHRLVGPVRTDYGFYVFTVTRIVPARQQAFAEVREAIKDSLVAEREQAALDAFVQDFTTRWRAKTECAKGFETTDCRNGPAPSRTPPVLSRVAGS
jgi:foldase protein PrsA